DLDAPPNPAVSNIARDHPRTFPHRRALRPIRSDDPGPLRNRISGLERRRQDLDALSVPLQAPGPAPAPTHLRTLPTTFRLESLVPFARNWAGKSFRTLYRGAFAARILARPLVFCR